MLLVRFQLTTPIHVVTWLLFLVYFNSVTHTSMLGIPHQVTSNNKCCNWFVQVRFDDTNPTKEKDEYVESIIKDMGTLGLQYKEITYTSDYFPQVGRTTTSTSSSTSVMQVQHICSTCAAELYSGQSDLKHMIRPLFCSLEMAPA